MELVSKIVKKFAKTATKTLTATVKEEAKNTAVKAFPILAGAGLLLIGIRIFRSSSAGPLLRSGLPAFGTMSIVTNNFFFDPLLQKDALGKVI